MSNISKSIIDTERLYLRELTTDDASFIFALVNSPDFHRYIGDKSVRNLEDAREYIRNGPQVSYRSNGFGLYCTLIKSSETPIGICGLVKRDTLELPDIGFAFLPEYYGKGFGYESAKGVLEHDVAAGFAQIAAITSPDNDRSIKLLKKLGFNFKGHKQMADNEPPCKYFERPGNQPE